MATKLFSTKKATPDGDAVTTDAVDSTGCDFIYVAVHSYSGSNEPAFSDSKGNTWIPLTSNAGGVSNDSRISTYYCLDPTVGTGHTFTADSPVGNAFPSITAIGFSGANGGLIAEDWAALDTPGTSLDSPTLDPGANDCIVISTITLNEAVGSLTAANMTVEQYQPHSFGQYMGGALAYEIQTTEVDRKAEWDWTTAAEAVVHIAVFGAGGDNPPTVDAGSDQTIILPPGTTTLAGSVSDDVSATAQWSVVSAPPAGVVTFGDDTDPTTGVSFSHHGTYVLRLTADDGVNAPVTDDVTITVIPPSGGGTTIGVNNVPLTRVIENPGRRGIRIELNLGSTWICDLETWDDDSTAGAYRSSIRDLLTIDYEGQRLFRGQVQTRRDRPRARTNKGNRMPIRAKANILITDRIEVYGFTVAAGTTLKAAVTALHSFGDPSIADEGVALDPDMLDGPTLEALTLDGVTMQAAFNRLMDRTGWIIRLTPEDVLESFEPGTKTADYALTADNLFALGPVTWEETARRFVNRVIVQYGTGRRSTTETFTGDGVTTTFQLTYPMDGYLAYTANGAVGYGVVDVSWGSGTEPLGGLSSTLDWRYDPDAKTVTRTTGAPANGDTFTVRKDSDFPLTVTVEDAVSIADPNIGLWQRTFRLPDVYDIDEATEQAEGLLRAGTSTPKVITVRTKKFPMPLPGDVINLNFPDRLIPDDNYLIVKVEAEDYVDQKFEFVLTCVEGTELQRTWTDTLKRLIGAG